MIEDELTEQIILAAIEVHKHWGPGLCEEICLLFLLHNNDSFAKVKVSTSLTVALAKPHLSELRAFGPLW